jgi:hypothetical protein
VGPGAPGELVGEPLDVGAAAPGVDDPAGARFLLEEELGCSDWVWPWVAAIASMQVRPTLLNTSCAVSDQPEVWLWVRSDSDLALFGSNCFTSLAQSSRPARSLATSMKKFMPIAQKNESRGANASMSRPDPRPARRYSTPSASV